jgi:hypothetical protein
MKRNERSDLWAKLMRGVDITGKPDEKWVGTNVFDYLLCRRFFISRFWSN